MEGKQMKKFSTLIKLLVTTLTLSGCSVYHNLMCGSCDSYSAYRAGAHDARRGHPMQKNYAILCPTAQRNNLNQMYIRGYKCGLNLHEPYCKWHSSYYNRFPKRKRYCD